MNSHKLAAPALVLALAAAGCTQAEAQGAFHSAAATALGYLQLAQQNPAMVDAARAAVVALVQQAAPKDAPAISAALAHLDAGSIANAHQVVQAAVAWSASPGMVTATGGAP